MGESNESKFFQNKFVQILIAIAIPNIGRFLIFLILANKIEDNEQKDRIEPSYGPPDYVVGIAWTIIYTITGFASWKIWAIGKKKKVDVRIPLRFYMITLLLNWLWPVIAFGFDFLLGAIIEMIILLIFVVITGKMFYKIDKISGYTYVPYFLYLSYATILCIHIYILNF